MERIMKGEQKILIWMVHIFLFNLVYSIISFYLLYITLLLYRIYFVIIAPIINDIIYHMWKNPNFILSFCLMSIRLVIALLNQVHHNKKIINPTKEFNTYILKNFIWLMITQNIYMFYTRCHKSIFLVFGIFWS